MGIGIKNPNEFIYCRVYLISIKYVNATTRKPPTMSEEKKPSWTDDHIKYIKGLKSATEQQQLLVVLHEMGSRTASDEKKYRAIERAEKIAEKAAKARREASAYIQSEAKAKAAADRKARTHRLILQGALVDISGLQDRSHAEILGMLMAGAGTTDAARWEHWKIKGESMLAQRKDELGKLTA